MLLRTVAIVPSVYAGTRHCVESFSIPPDILGKEGSASINDTAVPGLAIGLADLCLM
jgi:hypothetical protein